MVKRLTSKTIRTRGLTNGASMTDLRSEEIFRFIFRLTFRWFSREPRRENEKQKKKKKIDLIVVS